MNQIVSLNGNNWRLLPLLPHVWDDRKVWQENWDPATEVPAHPDWISGTVPGDVISDGLAAGLIPDPFFEINSRSCEWLCQRDWLYVREFEAPAMASGAVARLCFEGVDHECRVYLNGEFVTKHAGMNLPFEADVTSLLRQGATNRLTVVVMHAPPVDAVQGQVGRTRDARVWKARYAYGWDWCTRLVPLGIWRSVTLAITGPAWLEDVWVRSELALGETAAASFLISATIGNAPALPADAQLVAEVRGHGAAETVTITLSHGESSIRVPVPDPKLWWPNGWGEQPLYAVSLRLEVGGRTLDQKTLRAGLRQAQLVPNSDAPADALAYTIEVNGQRMFAKGYNWVPLDHSVGSDQNPNDRGRYQTLIKLAAESHVNLLRVWGGGFLESRNFYDLCDELGILIWQEFLMSSSGIENWPADDQPFLDYIADQARQLVPQRRSYTSLLCWCGGNELMDRDLNPLTETTHTSLAVLKRVVDELDPGRAWLPASPSGPAWHSEPDLAGSGDMHDVHGPWLYLGQEKHYRHYNAIDPLLHAEFGVQGAANIDTLRRFCSEKNLWPPDRSNPVWVHHGNWWLGYEFLTDLFGPLDNIEDYVKASQWLHAQGLRYACDAHRRRWPRCSGTLPWQFNEAFPNFVCTNVVDYLGQPKPAYHAVKGAYAPVSISLQYDKITVEPGGSWRAALWVVSDRPLPAGCDWVARVDGVEQFAYFGAIVDEGATRVLCTQMGKVVGDTAGLFYVTLTLRGPADEILAEQVCHFAVAEPGAPAPFRDLLPHL